MFSIRIKTIHKDGKSFKAYDIFFHTSLGKRYLLIPYTSEENKKYKGRITESICNELLSRGLATLEDATE